MSDNNQSLFGLPIIVTDAILKSEMVFGRFPTWEDVLEHGSFKAAVEAQKKEYGITAKIVNIDVDTD